MKYLPYIVFTAAALVAAGVGYFVKSALGAIDEAARWGA